VIISRQNLRTQRLTFPEHWYPEKPIGMSWKPLTAETRVGDIPFYDEVKVPIDAENPLMVVPRDEFLEVLERFGGREVEVPEFLDALRRAPGANLKP
jgi:hypothetical protein